MRESDAAEVVAIIAGAFPNLTLETDAARLWATLFAELDDAQIAYTVALGIARNQEKPPTIAGFREQYHAAVRRKRESAANERGLEPAPEGPQELPESVREWMSGRGIRTP